VVTTECPFISWQKFLASFYRIERCQLSCLDVLSTGWQVRTRLAFAMSGKEALPWNFTVEPL
jgi:hypothetical protein